MKTSLPFFIAITACMGVSLVPVKGVTLTDFEQTSDRDLNWRVVNDGVMGGLSKGEFKMTDRGTMRFSGKLSLENNGGFSSVRTNEFSLDLSKAEGLRMRVKGDGRTYQVRLSTDAKFRGREMSFKAEFPTKDNRWTDVIVPFSDFAGTWRGRSLPDKKFDPSNVTRLGILLADKQAGEFDLEIDYIRTYGDPAKKIEAKDVSDPIDRMPIAAIALNNERFSTLVAAAKAAGLVEFLRKEGPITVFAPTNKAFSKLPEGNVDALLKPENKEQLKAILKNHVVKGSVTLADALKAKTGKTLQGSPIEVRFSKGKVKVNDASLLEADIQAANGVIHVIDQVLFPAEKPEPKTVVSFAKQAGSYDTLVAALEATGLDADLKKKGPFTVFAPRDVAFSKLPEKALKNLMKPENKGRLKDLLLGHVVAGKIGAGDALNAKSAKTLNGQVLKIGVNKGRLQVNGANILKVDIDGGNGVIHVIDQVLLPRNKPGHEGDKQSNNESSSKGVLQLAMGAIDKGVPLYNSGDAKGCADVYQACLTKMVNKESLDDPLRHKLEKVLQKGKKMGADDRAWLYRHALDGVISIHH